MIPSRVPEELARLIDHCLVKDPTRRIQSALDLRYQLEEVHANIAANRGSRHGGAVRTSARGNIIRAVTRWPIGAALGAVVLLAGLWFPSRTAPGLAPLHLRAELGSDASLATGSPSLPTGS